MVSLGNAPDARPPRLARADLAGALLAGATAIGFCLVLLWHDPLLFWNDDYELSILPVFADVARSWSEGHLPLLSPYSWICGNLAGEFQYGTFSVFLNAAVVAIWRFPLTFPQQAAALSMVHLCVLAMGAYLLARGREVSRPTATMVSLVAALNGWIICWGATDWFGALAAFAWLPWAWWAAERAVSPNRTRWSFLWLPPFVYLLITGGFPYTVVMLALLLGWLAMRTVVRTGKVVAIWPLLVGALLGAGLSAPAWLALLDYVHGSARQVQESSAHFQWVVPFTGLPAFVLPSWTVNWRDFSTRSMPHVATEMACGLAPVAIVIWGIITHSGVVVRRLRWELGLLLVALIAAMLPTTNMFRWSFRWLPFVDVVLALLAAETVRVVAAAGNRGTMRRRIAPGVVAFAVTSLVAAAMYVIGTAGPLSRPFVSITLAIAAVWAFGELALPAPSAQREWFFPAATLASFLATYLCMPANCGVPKYQLAQTLAAPAPLDASRLYLSLYPQPEDFYRADRRAGFVGDVVRPGSTSMWGGVRFVNGYSPIRPAGVARELNVGIHGEVDFAVAKRLLETQSGAVGELATLGVDGLILAPELQLPPPPSPEWNAVYQSAEGTVYHRGQAAFATLRSVATLAGRGEQFATARISGVADSRNRLAAAVEVPAGTRPALLIASRPYFTGYQATLDGRPLAVASVRGFVPMVEIPAGSHGRFELVYRPRWLTVGAAVAGISLGLWGFGVAAAARERISRRL